MTILIVVVLAALFFALYWAGIYHKSQQKVRVLEASIGDLNAVRQFRADIYLQISQSVDFLLSGDDSDEDSYIKYKENSILSHEEWVKAIQKSVALGEDKSTEISRAQLLKKRFEQASEYIEQAFDSAEYGDNEKAYDLIENKVENWVNYDLSEEVNGALVAELGEVNEAYDNVLIWLGSMPWVADQTLREVRRARYALMDTLAADKILTSMSIQHKDFMDFLYSGKAEEKQEFEDFGLVASIELRDWVTNINSREELSESEKQGLLMRIRDLENIYQNLIEQSYEAFALKSRGQQSELLEFLDSSLQPSFHDLLYNQISAEIDRARADIDQSSRRLVDITYSAGIKGGLVMASGSMLAVLLMFLVMRGILRSLSRLQAGTENIGAGRFEHRINLNTRDELGELAASFDMMGERLERMRNEIIAAKQYTENILRSMKDTLLVVSTDGVIQTVNEAACRLLHYQESELVGQPVERILVDGLDLPQDLPDSGNSLLVEKNYRLQSGQLIPVSYSSSILRDQQGQPQGVVCVAQDITDRKQAEEELRTSERKYRQLFKEFHALLDAIPDSLTLLDSELKILWANKGAERYLGLPAEALAGKFCYQVRFGYPTSCDHCPVRNSFSSGLEEQSQHVAEDGKYYDIRAFPIKDDRGKVTSVIEVISDISEKMKLQADAAQAAHLASVGELAAGVAHEINNPINSIINYAQILHDEAEVDASRDILNRILADGERIATIVRSLLSFARVGNEEKHPAAMSDILENTLALTRTQLRKEGIILQIDCPEQLPLVRANPQQIEQVFLNVINNARYALNQKYAAADEGKVLKIALEKISATGSPRVRVVFTDQGTGIAAASLNQVLHPFFSTKPMGVGTGLGLSISHGIVSDHGGTIQIASKEGEFTRVAIELPIDLGTSQLESEVV